MSSAKRRTTVKDLPGPKGLPLLGSLLEIDLKRLHRILEQWADLYGEMYHFKIAGKSVVAISDYELIQRILRDRPETYRRIQSLEMVAKELGSHGVFSAEGEQWRRYRQITMEAFRPDNLKRFYPTLKTTVDRLHERWRRLAESGSEIDVRKDWMRFTVDITTQFAFGFDINLLEKDSDDFQQHLERQLPAFNRRINAPFPYWHWFRLPGDRDMEKSLTVIKLTIDDFIQQTRQKLARQTDSENHPANFLEALLLSQQGDIAPLSNEEIQGNIITLLLAGEDTTAHSLSWLIYLMTEHPEIQHRMQLEADAVLADQKFPHYMHQLDQLAYIDAVAMETLRLKSVAPMLFIEPVVDVELNGVSIKKGTELILLTRQCALQDKNFAEASRFNPDRWLPTDPPPCPHNRQANLSFGAGPRFCPGRQLAMLEMKIAMAMVCKNFTVSRMDTGRPVEELFSFTMLPDNLRIRLSPR